MGTAPCYWASRYWAGLHAKHRYGSRVFPIRLKGFGAYVEHRRRHRHQHNILVCEQGALTAGGNAVRRLLQRQRGVDIQTQLLDARDRRRIRLRHAFGAAQLK